MRQKKGDMVRRGGKRRKGKELKWERTKLPRWPQNPGEEPV
jgi:hypothetical protein